MKVPHLEPVVPNARQMQDIATARKAFYHLVDTLETLLPDGRYSAMTATSVEAASLWAVKSILHDGSLAPED